MDIFPRPGTELNGDQVESVCVRIVGTCNLAFDSIVCLFQCILTLITCRFFTICTTCVNIERDQMFVHVLFYCESLSLWCCLQTEAFWAPLMISEPGGKISHRRLTFAATNKRVSGHPSVQIRACQRLPLGLADGRQVG